MMTVNGDRISANNLDELVFMKSKDIVKNEGFLTQSDLKYQDERRKRKVRKLNFEVRWWSISTKGTTITFIQQEF